MAYSCPKNPDHESTDADYCSVCGARIAGAPGPSVTGGSFNATANDTPNSVNLQSATGVAASGGPTGDAGGCPVCGTPRAGAKAKFCEVCRYNFETADPGAVFIATAPPEASPAGADPAPVIAVTPPPLFPAIAPNLPLSPPIPVPVASPPPVAPVAAPARDQNWEVVVQVDATLYTDPDPSTPCPAGQPDLHFPLDLNENLIGRRNDRRDIHPEIPLTDPGVSTRHAKLLRSPEGGWILLDVGSTNGTSIGGAIVPPGVMTPLRDGDEITLGCWTRMKLRCSAARGATP